MTILKLDNKIFNLDAFCAFEIDSENWVIWAYLPRLGEDGELEYVDHANTPVSTTLKSRIPTLSSKKISPFKS